MYPAGACAFCSTFTVTVSYPGALTGVVLATPCARTHSIGMDSRVVVLVGGALRVLLWMAGESKGTRKKERESRKEALSYTTLTKSFASWIHTKLTHAAFAYYFDMHNVRVCVPPPSCHRAEPRPTTCPPPTPTPR